MPGDPFYRSPLWLRLRRAALDRDRHRCVVPGCTERATHVDHIVSRRKGGPDTLANLRSLCHGCHSRATAAADGGFGNRRSLKRPVSADGWPLKPAKG